MKRVLWIIVLLSICGYFVRLYLENSTERKTEKAETKRVDQETKSAIEEMVSRTNAINDWEQNLCKGKQFRFEPILTIELEKLWLISHKGIDCLF